MFHFEFLLAARNTETLQKNASKLLLKVLLVHVHVNCRLNTSLGEWSDIKVRNDSVRKNWLMQSCVLTLQITKKIETLKMENL